MSVACIWEDLSHSLEELTHDLAPHLPKNSVVGSQTPMDRFCESLTIRPLCRTAHAFDEPKEFRNPSWQEGAKRNLHLASSK